MTEPFDHDKELERLSREAMEQAESDLLQQADVAAFNEEAERIFRQWQEGDAHALGELLTHEWDKQLATLSFDDPFFKDLTLSPTVEEEEPAVQLRSDATAKDVALWMAQILQERGVLYQWWVARQLVRGSADRFIYKNRHGNPAISPEVLGEFRGLNDKTVVWVQKEKKWRPRVPSDKPGRRQGSELPRACEVRGQP